MTRATRLFEVIQLLRSASKPLTARDMAAELEVAQRTIYRDIAVLQARRVPIEGEAGVGYIMRPGFDLPPLAFTTDEIEAIVVGLALLQRTGDAGLLKAAGRVSDKIAAASDMGSNAVTSRFFISRWGVPEASVCDPGRIRQAIRDERKLRISYEALDGTRSERTVLPVVLGFFAEVSVLAAWCELRDGFRHFRLDRISAMTELEDRFSGKGPSLRDAWWNREGRRGGM